MASRRKIAALTALALASAPVVANATVLFQENFNTGTAGSRFDQFSQDADTIANFNFNYGAFTYWHENFNGTLANLSDLIPKAPQSGVAEPKIGLKLEVNNVTPAALTAIVLYPKLAEYTGGVLPTGDHQLTFDLWMNYAGRYEGAIGSTEWISAGLVQQGGGLGGGVLVAAPNLPGQAILFDGDRGNGFDYRQYTGNVQWAEVDARAGYAAVNVVGPGNPGPSDGTNPYYVNTLFPRVNPNNPTELWHETEGAMGKHWQTIKYKIEDGIIYAYVKVDGTADYQLISARTDESLTTGHMQLGYSDRNAGVCLLEDGDGSLGPGGFGDHNFGVVDNVLLETVTQTRQKWTNNGNGNWSDTTKWLGSDDADGKAEVADFTTALTAARTVSVDSARTVRSVTFDSTANGYTLAGANTITMDSITTGIRGKIKAVTGAHTISAPVVLNKPLTFDVAAGSSVKLTDVSFNIVMPDIEYIPDPQVLVKNGAGVAEVNRIIASGTTSTVVVNAGILRVSPNSTATGVSRIQNVTINTGGRLDLTDNKLITRTALGTFNGTNYTGVTGMVASGKGTSNSWNGATGIITSQTAAINSNFHSIGVSTGTAVLISRGFTATDTMVWAGQTISASNTLVMYTYGGDANLDGKLNIDDYIAIDQGISSGLTGWSNGDYNYDGKVNIDDYTTVIDSNIGNQNGFVFPNGGGIDSGVAAVPEPAVLGLLGLGLPLLRGRRRR